jgi:uncharacterized protein YjiS (DUF1127 family)
MTVAARQKTDEGSLGEIRRCTVVDMPEWGPWLLGRLREKWPTIGNGSLLGKIGAWSASNEFLFIRNDLAVLLAIVMHDNVDGRPYVRAMFAFARDGAPQSSASEHAIVALYRRMREWAKSMRATRVYFSGRSDIGLSRRQTLLSAEKETEIFSTVG